MSTKSSSRTFQGSSYLSQGREENINVFKPLIYIKNMGREYQIKELLLILKDRGYNIPKAKTEKFLLELRVNTPEMKPVVNDFCDRIGIMSPYEFEEQAADSILTQLKTGKDLIDYAKNISRQGEEIEIH